MYIKPIEIMYYKYKGFDGHCQYADTFFFCIAEYRRNLYAGIKRNRHYRTQQTGAKFRVSTFLAPVIRIYIMVSSFARFAAQDRPAVETAFGEADRRAAVSDLYRAQYAGQAQRKRDILRDRPEPEDTPREVYLKP